MEIGSGNAFKVTLLDFYLEKPKLENWKVGRDFATTINKGFLIGLKLPVLSNKDAEQLWREKKVDSWYIRIFRLGHMGHEVMLQLVAPYGTVKHGEFSKGSISKIAFNIHYAAAAMSTRLANLQCPAMNHRKIISDFILRDESPDFRVMTVSAIEENPPSGKVESFSFGKIIVNGGSSLKGTYSAEISFYSSIYKKIMSNAVNFPQVILITKEDEVDVPGCTDVEVPSYNPDDPANKRDTESFKFGR
jgi:hypothetical protein